MDTIAHLLAADEIILPGSPRDKVESRVWAAQKNLHPKMVARPKTVKTLTSLIAALCKTDLDIAVRSGGCGSSSARDVLISLTAFDGFRLDKVSEYIEIGAGQTWGEVDQKLYEQAGPDCAYPSARCAYVGVGGSILTGGISWLSSEYGLASDPQNMLDAQIVKSDGQVVWASQEPDLLFALRGGGGGFGSR